MCFFSFFLIFFNFYRLGHKRSLYEGGVRSPTMARWPKKIKAGTVSNYQWAFYDAMATFADLIGAPARGRTDGISILPTLLGKTQDPKPYIFNTWRGTGVEDDHLELPDGWTRVQNKVGVLEYVHEDGRVSAAHPARATSDKKGSGASAYGISVGDFKGVVAHCSDTSALQPSDGDVFEIYDLAIDPFETNDISATDVGKEKIKMFLSILNKANVTCACFQC